MGITVDTLNRQVYFFDEGKIVKYDYDKKIPTMSISLPIAYKFNGNLYLKDYWSDTVYVADGIHDANAYAVIQKGRFVPCDVPDRSLVQGGEPSPEDRATIYAHPDQLVIKGNHKITDEHYDRYRKMVEKLDPEDNPVLMILKLKKWAVAVRGREGICNTVSKGVFQNI
ncbi:MAG: hypothetical protein LBS42_03650 [Tannerella sp.]|jgi:hypothetical protein|nr:hypothetical protein [Tannerella sp.]